MVRDYELMYIVRPELEDDAVRVAVKSVRSLIESTRARLSRPRSGASAGSPTR